MPFPKALLAGAAALSGLHGIVSPDRAVKEGRRVSKRIQEKEVCLLDEKPCRVEERRGLSRVARHANLGQSHLTSVPQPAQL